MVDIAREKRAEKPLITKDDIFYVLGEAPRDFTEMQKRFKALGHYLDTPVPQRVRHLWRYSSPALFFPENVRPAHMVAASARGPASRERGAVLHPLPHHAPTVHLHEEAAEAKVEVAPIGRSERGLELLGAAVPLNHGLFEAAVGAVWSTSLFVRVPEGVHLKEPLRIVHSAAGRLSVTRVVVEIAAGAEATVVETYKDGDEGCLMLAVSELFVRNTARLNHLVVQDLGAGVRGHVTSRAVVRRDAALKTGLIHLGGGHYKADVGAVLDGVGAESVIAGVSMTDRRQHMDLHTVHHHVAERTRSNINYKTAAAGRSESVYTGLIQVDEAAKLSEAFQENRNLMLSDRCRVEAIPELEIRTREVQCTHAATSAPIDDAQLFYLMSRGVDRGEATKMLVRGFFEKALGLAPQGLRQEIEACVDKRLLAMTGRGVR